MARNTTRTIQGYLAGIGASGALLAGILVAFFSLVGAVSVSSWPEPGRDGAIEVVELPTPDVAQTELAEAEGLVAAVDTPPPVTVESPDRPAAPDPGRGDGPQGPGGRPGPPDEGAAPPAEGPADQPEPPAQGPDGRENDHGDDGPQSKGGDDHECGLVGGDGDGDGDRDDDDAHEGWDDIREEPLDAIDETSSPVWDEHQDD